MPITTGEMFVNPKASSGGSGTPGGSSTQVQYNQAGAFSANSGFTTDTSGNVTTLSLTTGAITTSGQATMNRSVSPGASVNEVLLIQPTYALVAGETAFGLNSTLTNSGSVTPNVGDHAFGMVGRFIDSATGKTNSGGGEFRVDGAGTASIYEAGFMLANFVGASFSGQSLYGVTVQNSITTNGSTPLVSGTNVGVYIPPLVGGATVFGLFTSNNTQSANLTAAYVSGVSGSPPTGSYTTIYHDNDSAILNCGGGASGHLKLQPASGAYVFVAAGLGFAPLTSTQNALGVAGFGWNVYAASLTNVGTTTLTPVARTGTVTGYEIRTPAPDTALTSATEAPGFVSVTATRTWVSATAATALQRENVWNGVTYASAGGTQTLTDACTAYFTPPIQGSGVAITRNHTLLVVDATSAASAITGGIVVATTLGTAATSVGIGGGNINAGGTIKSGGTIIASAAITSSVTNSAAQNLVIATNTNTSSPGGAYFQAVNSADSLIVGISGTGSGAATITNAAVGESGNIYTNAAKPLYFGTNSSLGLVIDGSQNVQIYGNTTTFNGLLAGNANTYTQLVKSVASIANNTGTSVLTITVPNAAHSAIVDVILRGSLGAGGAIGANEATGSVSYSIALTRTAGVNLVAGISSAYGSATSSVAGGATITVTAALAAVSGAVGATNTVAVNITIAAGTGSSTNHTCQVIATVANANVTGVTLS